MQGHLTKFAQQGASGQWVSEFLPYHAKFVDDIAIIRSMPRCEKSTANRPPEPSVSTGEVE